MKIEITSYKAACQVNGQDPNEKIVVTGVSESEAKDAIDNIKLKRVVRALNTDQETGKVWEPNWNDKKERKYTVWVEVEASKTKPEGFAFRYSFLVTWATRTTVGLGSRLCLQSGEKAQQLLDNFSELCINATLIIE